MPSFTMNKCCGSPDLVVLNSHGSMAFYECKSCHKQFHDVMLPLVKKKDQNCPDLLPKKAKVKPGLILRPNPLVVPRIVERPRSMGHALGRKT